MLRTNIQWTGQYWRHNKENPHHSQTRECKSTRKKCGSVLVTRQYWLFWTKLFFALIKSSLCNLVYWWKSLDTDQVFLNPAFPFFELVLKWSYRSLHIWLSSWKCNSIVSFVYYSHEILRCSQSEPEDRMSPLPRFLVLFAKLRFFYQDILFKFDITKLMHCFSEAYHDVTQRMGKRVLFTKDDYSWGVHHRS